MDIDETAILQMFVAESEEGLTLIEATLLALETSGGDDEALHAMFRAAHTLKGNALNLDFAGLADVAHALEDVLGELRDHRITPDRAVVSALLLAVDALGDMVPAAAAGDLSSSPKAQAALQALQDVCTGAGLHPCATETMPSGGAAAPAREADPRRRTLRINVETLDRLLNLTGEIAVSRARLQSALTAGGPGALTAALEAHHEADRLHGDLQELVLCARMIPLGPTFRSYGRAVRDVAAAHGKQARLLIEGEDVEVDTRVVEQLHEPLTHMIRNALDHGIETAGVRQGRGKDPCGTIRLSARHEAGRLLVEVSDDGAGLNRERILARAIQAGLADEASAPSLSTADVHRLLFTPGFSTAETVTDLSGRGVGLDVVRRNVEALRGTIALDSRIGEGTTVKVRLPLTVAIVPGFAVGVGDETYVLPLESVLECLELPAGARRQAEETGVLNLRGEPLPYLRLRHPLGCLAPPGEREHVVVVQYEGGRAGVAVDALLGESQSVLKPLGGLLGDVPGIAGAAVLGGGTVGLVLDVPALLEERLARAAAAPEANAGRT